MPGDDSYAGQGATDDRCRRRDVHGGAAMTPARTLLIAMVAVALVVGARPIAGANSFRAACCCPGSQSSRLLHDRDASAEFWRLRPARRSGYRCDRPDHLHLRKGNGPRQEPGERASASRWRRARNSFAPRGMVGAWTRGLEYNIYLDATHRRSGAPARGHSGLYRYDPPNRTPVTVPAFGRISQAGCGCRDVQRQVA